MPCWRRKKTTSSPSTKCLSGSATSCAHSMASGPAASLAHLPANCVNTSARGSAGCIFSTNTALGVVWPTTWDWARRSRFWHSSTSGAGILRRTVAAKACENEQQFARSLARRRAAEPGLQLDRGSPPVHPRTEGSQLHRLGSQCRLGPVARPKPGHHDVRHCAARHCETPRSRVRLRDSRRGAGHQECNVTGREGVSTARGAAAVGA